MKKTFLTSMLACIALAWPCNMLADNVYTIYPVPQEQIKVNENPWWDGGKYEVVCEEGIDRATKVRLLNILFASGAAAPGWDAPTDFDALVDAIPTKATGTQWPVIYLGINGSGGAADVKATKKGLSRDIFTLEGKYDRHLLSISNSGDEYNSADFIILGEHTDAVFHGLASLEQIFEQRESADKIQAVTIYDYADQQSRGLVEGYYGYPYTIAVKKDLMRFMMRYKMNTYLYGAKSDPYHSQYWKQPYPTTLTDEQVKNGWLSQDMVREISSVSAETKVNFIWAIHPGNDFTGSSTVIGDIMGKFEKMYSLGVRQFAVFVDDVSVPGDAETHKLNANRLTQLQREIEAKWNAEGTAAADTVKPVHFVPQVYASSFVNADVRRSFFNALSTVPANVTIYTTGWGVWTVPNSNDLKVVKDDLGRNVAWWWNYPCNDNADGQIYPMDTYSNFYDLPAVDANARLESNLQHGLGIVSNPMQQGEVSKTALFSVADYAWNNSGFDNTESWNASFKAVVKNEEVAKAYQTLAYYLRYNDPEELQTAINSYKNTLKNGKPQPDALNAKMDEILQACNILVRLKDSDVESDRLLYTDLAPWLLKLQQMATGVKELLAVASMSDDDNEKWEKFVPALKGIEALETDERYTAFALEGMGNGISVSQRQSQPGQLHLYPFVKEFKTLALGNFFTPKAGDEVLTNVEGIRAIKGTGTGIVYLTMPNTTLNKGEYIGLTLGTAMQCKSVTLDATLLESVSLIYSSNGKEWVRVKSASEVPSVIKHIAFINESDEPQKISLTKTKFCINLPTLPKVSSSSAPATNFWENHNAGFFVDGDYTTFCTLNRNQQNGDAYTVVLASATAITDVRVAVGTTNGDYMNTGKVQVSSDGKTWKDLKVKGTNQTTFGISKMQTLSPDVKYIDMDGAGIEAKYVRLYVQSANTSKWLRLYEIEVNKQGLLAAAEHVCIDGTGAEMQQLSDGKGHTSVADAVSALTYRFQQIHPLTSVRIYRDASVEAASAEIKVTLDGETWTTVGTLSGYVTEINFATMPWALAMKIEWNGAAPAIYEIVEEVDKTQVPTITDIKSVEAVSAQMPVFKNGRLHLSASQGLKQVKLYSADGKLLVQQSCGGSHEAMLAVPAAQPGSIILVQVQEQNGRTSAYKIVAGR